MEKIGNQTLAVHAGELSDPNTAATTPNIVMATSYKTDADAKFSVEDQEEGKAQYMYTRWGNPTVDQLAKKLSALEGAQRCLVFGSGMAAISTLFLHELQSGDHMVMSDVSYAGASEMSNDILTKMNIEVTRVNMSKLDLVQSAMRTNTKLVHIESPCNPLCRLTDIAAVANIVHASGAKLSIDSTFATPLATKPIALGADYVIHSLTKFISGHGDAIGGALLGPKEDLIKMHGSVAAKLGGIISPFNAWLIMRGCSTLPIRMRVHEENALKIATYLESHPKIKQVIYPGLNSHPQHELAKKQMDNFSGMLQFQVDEGEKLASIFSSHLEYFHYAVSLGHHKSLIFYIDTETMLKTSFHLTSDQEADYRIYAGDGIFRLSAGIEDAEDLIADLDKSLALY